MCISNSQTQQHSNYLWHAVREWSTTYKPMINPQDNLHSCRRSMTQGQTDQWGPAFVLRSWETVEMLCCHVTRIKIMGTVLGIYKAIIWRILIILNSMTKETLLCKLCTIWDSLKLYKPIQTITIQIVHYNNRWKTKSRKNYS